MYFYPLKIFITLKINPKSDCFRLLLENNQILAFQFKFESVCKVASFKFQTCVKSLKVGEGEVRNYK